MEFVGSNVPAVSIRNAHKKFKGSGPKGTIVLKNFSMTVNTGTLYSLIGSSGCGKTTVLACLVGVHKLDRGYLSIFGSRSVPVSPNRWQRIGYMPQEISLYTQFTIFETLSYFGALFDTGRETTSRRYLKDRMQFLEELLFLPDLKRTFGTLSGGEKRRVSFAVALINEPELLLLDEPTSGVDPLVRECIWKHLSYLAAKKGTTIIVTTHYIDEAKNSNIVGMMRNGRLIAEDSPTNLLNTYQVNSLEGVFLALCKLQNQVTSCFPSTSSSSGVLTPSFKPPCVTFEDRSSLQRRKSVFSTSRRVRNSGQRIQALLTKNYKVLIRSIWSLLYTMVPILGVFLVCAGMGQFPSNLPLGVINHDVSTSEQCLNNNLLLSGEEDCSMDRLSCCFLKEIPTDILNLKIFNTTEEALSSADKGDIRGYLSFPKNYSIGVMTKMVSSNPADFPDDDLEEMRLWNSSKISIRLDQTNHVIRYRIISVLYKAFGSSAEKMLREYGLDERNAQSPLQFGEPLVGKDNGSLLTQTAPGFALWALLFFPMTISVRYITEKRQGTMDRCLAAGTQVWEILAAQTILETGVLVYQASVTYSLLFYGFDIGLPIIDNYVSVILALVLCVLAGINGLAVGMLLGVLCTEESQAALAMMGITFPLIFLSGIFWPLQGMPTVLQVISKFSPLTLSGEALQVLMSRDADFFHSKVWPGFLVLAVYILACNLAIIFLIRSRRVR